MYTVCLCYYLHELYKRRVSKDNVTAENHLNRNPSYHAITFLFPQFSYFLGGIDQEQKANLLKIGLM